MLAVKLPPPSLCRSQSPVDDTAHPPPPPLELELASHLLDHEVPGHALVALVALALRAVLGHGGGGVGDGGGGAEEAGGGRRDALLRSPAGDDGVRGGRGQAQLVPLAAQLQVLLLPLVGRLLHHVLWREGR